VLAHAESTGCRAALLKQVLQIMTAGSLVLRLHRSRPRKAGRGRAPNTSSSGQVFWRCWKISSGSTASCAASWPASARPRAQSGTGLLGAASSASSSSLSLSLLRGRRPRLLDAARLPAAAGRCDPDGAPPTARVARACAVPSFGPRSRIRAELGSRRPAALVPAPACGLRSTPVHETAAREALCSPGDCRAERRLQGVLQATGSGPHL